MVETSKTKLKSALLLRCKQKPKVYLNNDQDRKVKKYKYEHKMVWTR